MEVLKSLKIDNFKALNNAKIEFTPFTVLIGDNSVGKTTILQAVAFLQYCCVSYLKLFMAERNLTVSDICSKFSSKRNISFEAEFRFSDKIIVWTIEIASDKSKNQFSLSSERVKAGDDTILLYDSKYAYRFNAKTKQKEPIMRAEYDGSFIKLIDANKDSEAYPELVAIKRFFQKSEILDLLSPAAMRNNSQGSSEIIGMSGEKLGSFIKRLSDTQRASLAKDVQQFIPAFTAIIPHTKQYGWVHLESAESYGEKLISVSGANISDGVLRILALCALAYRKQENEDIGAAIFLDEIEDGVNNEHLELLVKILRRIQEDQNVQIIATTHNTVLLDYWLGVDNSEYLDLYNKGGQDNFSSSIVYLSRDTLGSVSAKNLFSSDAIREQLGYMYPGEVVLNMSNHEIKNALRAADAVYGEACGK